MKWDDACDDRDGLLHYRTLRARAPEGLTAKSVMVVTVVTTGHLSIHALSASSRPGRPTIQAGHNLLRPLGRGIGPERP
jgi:hypothetical protein